MGWHCGTLSQEYNNVSHYYGAVDDSQSKRSRFKLICSPVCKSSVYTNAAANVHVSFCRSSEWSIINKEWRVHPGSFFIDLCLLKSLTFSLSLWIIPWEYHGTCFCKITLKTILCITQNFLCTRPPWITGASSFLTKTVLNRMIKTIEVTRTLFICESELPKQHRWNQLRFQCVAQTQLK